MHIGKSKPALPDFSHQGMFPLLLVILLGVCYSLSIAPDLTWSHFSADGGDLISAAATGGVPHPTGYPLYLILARGFQWLPIGNLAFRTNLLSAFCTVLTALLLYVYLFQNLSKHRLTSFVAFLAAMAYGLAPFVWGQALVTEVYSLHGLLMMLCIYLLSLRGLNLTECVRGLVFGIAATNHLTAILMFPLLWWGSEEKLFVSASVLLKRGVGVLVGLSLYLTLPLRAHFDPPINWGNPSTFDGFFWLVSGQLYHQYMFSLSLADILQRLRAFVGLLFDQFSWFGVLLGIYGLISFSSRRVLIPTLWMAIVLLLFAVSYGSLDSQVNLLPVWLAFTIWLAYGLQDVLELFPGRTRLQISIVGLLFVALLIRTFLLFPSVDVSGDFRARDFIKIAMQNVPQDSIVFVDGDEQIFSLWYARFALKQRSDMAIIAEELLPYKWYDENLRHTYQFLNVPQNEILRTTDLSEANPGRTLCYISHNNPMVCIDH